MHTYLPTYIHTYIGRKLRNVLLSAALKEGTVDFTDAEWNAFQISDAGVCVCACVCVYVYIDISIYKY